MSTHRNRASEMLGDYTNMRSLPALLSVLFVAASAYQFGAIDPIVFNWFGGTGGYTLTTEHSILISLGAFAAAFASSETREFDAYETWEQAAIASGPAVILGHQYTTQVTDVLMGLGDPLGLQVAFVASIISWGVAVQ